MGKLIIIEGTDGSGKQTQAEMVYEKIALLKGKDRTRKVSFPNYESRAAEPVKMYLEGEFGETAGSVNAYASSVFFSVDRFASFKTEWENFYNEGGIVVSDRYTTSNMVHQIPKIEDEAEKEKYLEWLTDLEYSKIGIPEPDIVFFLDMPPKFSRKLMKNRANKITGDKEKDIHEKDEKYLENSYSAAKELAKKYSWEIIECVRDGEIRPSEEINNEIMEKLKKML